MGGNGNDLLLGGEGKDLVLAGFGFDSAKGGKQHDIISGGKGRDPCVSGKDDKGGDRVHGGPDEDVGDADAGDSVTSVEAFFPGCHGT